MRSTTDISDSALARAPIVILRSGGSLRGEHVQELRRIWRRLQAAGVDRVRVELANVRTIDAAGRELLGEMRRHGVAIDGNDALVGPAHDGTPPPARARVVRLQPRLRIATRVVPPTPGFTPRAGCGVLISLERRRVSRRRPERSAERGWLIVTMAAMLLFVLVWRCLH